MLGWPDLLDLVRHGESEGNVARDRAYAAGAEELELSAPDPGVALSERGRAQAELLGRWYAAQPETGRPTVALVSPYTRTRVTAELLLATAGLRLEPVLDERLRDREQGTFDRLTWTGISRRHPAEAERRRRLGKFWFRPPEGESWADVAGRVRAAITDLRLQFAGERVLVVTHDVPLLCVRLAVERLDPDTIVGLSGSVGNCSLTRYRSSGTGAPGLECFNDTAALGA